MKGFVLKGVKQLLYPKFLEDVDSLPLILNEDRVAYFQVRLNEYLGDKNKMQREVCIEYLLKDVEYELKRCTGDVVGLKKVEQIIRAH